MPTRTNPDKAELLALALAQGEPIGAWARANDVSERTAYRWARRSDVRRRVDELRGEMLDQAVATLAKIGTTAAVTLWSLTTDEHPSAIRLGAARAILSSLIALESHATLSRRIAQLEGRLTPEAAPALAIEDDIDEEDDE